MSRAELLGAAFTKLEEAASYLAAAGEDRLAVDALELAEWVDFSSIPVDGKNVADRAQH